MHCLWWWQPKVGIVHISSPLGLPQPLNTNVQTSWPGVPTLPPCVLACLPCSAILAAAQAGQLTAADALHQLRALCDHAISTSWRTGQHAVAQAASELLDEGNELLAELGEGPAASGGATQPVAMGQQPQEPAVSPRLQLPAETFFPDADQLRECLTLNIDSSILMAAQPPRRTGGWPLGRKRKGDGIGGAALGAQEGWSG